MSARHGEYRSRLALVESPRAALVAVTSSSTVRRLPLERALTAMLAEVSHVARRVSPDARIFGRCKSDQSAVAKAARLGVRPHLLQDLVGIRIVVHTERHCYSVAKRLCGAFRHVVSEYDDYIRYPKRNGYQALHLLILDRHERPVEVQIRSHAMDRRAESGNASHAHYKNQLAESSRT